MQSQGGESQTPPALLHFHSEHQTSPGVEEPWSMRSRAWELIRVGGEEEERIQAFSKRLLLPQAASWPENPWFLHEDLAAVHTPISPLETPAALHENQH